MENNDLRILIITESGLNWETFATWYSIHENTPKAQTSIYCVRSQKTPVSHYQWAKRLNIPFYSLNRQFEDDINNRLHIASQIEGNLLVVTPLVMLLEPFKKFDKDFIVNENIIYSEDRKKLQEYLNDIQLENKEINDPNCIFCPEASETNDASTLVSYKKGCGRWINKLKGCPFSNAAGLATEEMTMNEWRIVEMWKRMTNLYSATA